MRHEIKAGRVKGEKKKPAFGTSKKPFVGKDRNRKGRKVLGVKIDDAKIRPKAIKEPKYLKFFHEDLQPPCFVCGTFIGIEFHHIKEHSTDERVDSVGMPLCHKHHHGSELSPHGTPVKFKEHFPMNVQYAYASKMYKKFKDRL